MPGLGVRASERVLLGMMSSEERELAALRMTLRAQLGWVVQREEEAMVWQMGMVLIVFLSVFILVLR